jgi:hypothetical protein
MVARVFLFGFGEQLKSLVESDGLTAELGLFLSVPVGIVGRSWMLELSCLFWSTLASRLAAFNASIYCLSDSSFSLRARKKGKRLYFAQIDHPEMIMNEQINS